MGLASMSDHEHVSICILLHGAAHALTPLTGPFLSLDLMAANQSRGWPRLYLGLALKDELGQKDSLALKT